MRKISLLVVLITMVLFSCVDDKESAVVEQIRTAKTAWLQAQADLLKAQGEAQKILAETEKLKAENEAKNEAARIEIEKLKAQAEAAKTQAEAALLQAQAEQLQSEMEMENARFENEMRNAQLEYELAVLKNDVQKIKLQKKLAELQAELDLNPALRKLYGEYSTAIDELSGLNNQVASQNDIIFALEGSFNQQVDRTYNNPIKTKQQEIDRYGKLIEEAKETGGLSYDAAKAKIEELEKQLQDTILKIDAQNAIMINNYDEYVKLSKAADEANDKLDEALENLDKAMNAPAEKDNAINDLKLQGYNAVPQSYLAVENDIKNLAENTKKAKTEWEKATKALEDSTRVIAIVEKAKFDALAQFTPLKNEKDENEKTIQANTEKQNKAQGLIDGTNNDGLQSIYDKAKAEQDAADDLLTQLQDELKQLTSGTPEYAAKENAIEVQKGLCATKKDATATAKKNLDAQTAIVTAMQKANKTLGDRNVQIDKDLAKLDITLNGNVLEEGLVARLERLSNGIVEETGAYWLANNKAEADYNKASAAHDALNELYIAATSTDADYEPAIKAAQEAFDAANAAYDEASEALDGCTYMLAKAIRDAANANQKLIKDLKDIYQMGVDKEFEGLNSTISGYETQVANLKKELEELNKQLAKFNELTREEQEAELGIKVSERIENAKKAIADLKFAIEGKQAEIEQIQKLIEAQQAAE